MSNQLYSLFYITIDGTLLSEETGMTMSRTTGSQAVLTMAKGYAGESPGAQMIEFDVKNVIPQVGFEFEASTKMSSMIPVEIGCVSSGGERLIFKGFIIGDTVSQSVNQEAAYDFKARGAFAKWQ